MSIVSIEGRPVGNGHPTYFIAEVGINHNGDPGLAKEMVAAAWEAGADAVKIQTYITEKFLHPSHPGYRYDIEAQIDHRAEEQIWQFATERGINLFSTPEEFESLRFIAAHSPKLVKIAAMDFNYKDLIQAAAGLGRPIILSSGMSTMEEVLCALRWVREAGNSDAIVLHCVSCYPTPAEACNLRAMEAMKGMLDCPVGFSDHTLGIHIALAAVAMGADVIEKHFTLDKTLPGPDQAISTDPAELRALVHQAREIRAAWGDGYKHPAPQEAEPRRFKRRGVYAAAPLEAGTRLDSSRVVFFAPSHPGSQVTDWPRMEGRLLKRGIGAMEPILLDDVQ